MSANNKCVLLILLWRKNNSFIHLLTLNPKSISTVSKQGWGPGRTVDQFRDTHLHSFHWSTESKQFTLSWVFLEYRRKLENTEKTHVHMWNTCTLLVEKWLVDTRDQTCNLLADESTNHSSTVCAKIISHMTEIGRVLFVLFSFKPNIYLLYSLFLAK